MKCILQCCIVICIITGLFSCSVSSREQSFSAKLDEIDALIFSGDSSSALKQLDKASSDALTALHRISIYRRYMQLGQFDTAEKYLKKSVKKYADSSELRAVYVHFLLSDGQLEAAADAAEKLSGTPYASLSAEVFLQQASVSGSADFLSQNFASVYADAYLSSHDDRWLQNAALTAVVAGQYEAAFAYKPDASNTTNPLFWAQLAYDAAKYTTAIHLLEPAEGDAAGNELLLLADAYNAAGDEKRSEQCRQQLFALEDYTKPAAIYLNSARYARLHGSWNEEYSLLDTLVHLYPDFLPGLDMYMKFAVRCLDIPSENELAQAVRSTGFRSAGMKQYDAISRVSIYDATAALQKAAENDAGAGAVLFQYMMNPLISPGILPAEIEGNLWIQLEKATGKYGTLPAEWVETAVPVLISLNKTGDAEQLFTTYLKNTYHSNNIVEIFPQMTVKEREYAAYFAASGSSAPDIPLALHLYETVASDTAALCRYCAGFGDRSRISILMNLAELYAGKRNYQQALDLLSTAAGSTGDVRVKAEILYRMGYIQHITGNDSAAVVSLEYCLQQYDNHSKAILLLRELQ